MMVPASSRVLEFSNNCHSPSDGRFCEAMKTQRYSIGIKGKGTESYGHRQAMCGKSVGPGANYCATHEKQFTKMQIENARRRHEAKKAKGLTASLSVPYSQRVYEFACHSASCAPPPVGTGGSDKGDSGHASHQRDPDAMTENERLEKRRFQAGHAFETMPGYKKAGPKTPEQQRAAIQAVTKGGVDRRSHARQFNELIERIRVDQQTRLAESRRKRQT